MRIALSALFFVLVLAASGLAYAGPNSVKWVAQCMEDNKDAKASMDVIHKYCVCMNNKMSSTETLSISEWEKSHPKERVECDDEAGWN